MLSKHSVSRYLDRKLDDFDTVKRLSDKRLRAHINKLSPKPELPDYLYRHQRIGFLIAAHRDRFLYFYDPGTGKTALMLLTMRWRKRAGRPHRLLVLTPNVANIDNWVEQCEEHTPDLTPLPLYGSSEQRWQTLRNADPEAYDFVVINYDGLRAMVTELAHVKGKKNRKQMLMPGLLQEVSAKVDGVLPDESHLLQNHQSTTFKMVKAISLNTGACYPMTGTPCGRDPHPLWSQFFIADGGETLGKTLSIFRQAFFSCRKGYFGGDEYTFLKKMQPQLNRMMRHRSLRFRGDECLDLPERNPSVRRAHLPPDTKKWIDEAQAELKAAKGDWKMTDQAFAKMRQLSSGFLYARDDESRIAVEMSYNVKLEMLMSDLIGLPVDCKAVVWFEYKHSIEQIVQAMKKAKIGYAQMHGGVRDTVAQKKRFTDKDNCQVLLAHPKSAGPGLNLQIANYMFFYETPVDPKLRQQCEDRIRRPSQSKKCFYIDYVIEGTKDEQTLENLREGKNVVKQLFKGREDP